MTESRRGSRFSRPQKLSSILASVLSRQPQGRDLVERRMALLFASMLGDDLGSQCRFFFRGSVLHVVTPNPALAHQLRLDQGILLERLNDMHLGRRVQELRVRTGSI